jgi:hypothetical protein
MRVHPNYYGYDPYNSVLVEHVRMRVTRELPNERYYKMEDGYLIVVSETTTIQDIALSIADTVTLQYSPEKGWVEQTQDLLAKEFAVRTPLPYTPEGFDKLGTVWRDAVEKQGGFEKVEAQVQAYLAEWKADLKRCEWCEADGHTSLECDACPF